MPGTLQVHEPFVEWLTEWINYKKTGTLKQNSSDIFSTITLAVLNIQGRFYTQNLKEEL